MPPTIPKGKELLAQLVLGKNTGKIVYFDNGTGTDVPVKVTDAEAVIDAFPTWVLKNVII